MNSRWKACSSTYPPAIETVYDKARHDPAAPPGSPASRPESIWRTILKPYRYFLLSAAVLAADQITKLLVVRHIPLYTVARSFGGDFFRLIHVRNLGVAFSIGSGLAQPLRVILLIILPLVILGFAAFYVYRGRDLSSAQRWTLAAVVGGGLGNQIDRVFRPEGVVDFLDFKFYGIFGMERWPTFNIADSALVVSSIALFVLLIIHEIRIRKM